MEILLDKYFESDKIIESGLPTVQFFAEKLNLSPHYLSDILRVIIGQSTQQHIHNKLIEKAKEALSTTNLSISEIAYQLGFEHPQSFSKLFKTKMNVSPLEYRYLLTNDRQSQNNRQKGRAAVVLGVYLSAQAAFRFDRLLSGRTFARGK